MKKKTAPRRPPDTGGYIKVGRIRQPIARKAHIKAADVVIDRNHIRHIMNYHSRELEARFGITVLDYVTIVVARFNEIRKNKGDSILLVKRNRAGSHDTVTIELAYNPGKDLWEVKTAQPRRNLPPPLHRKAPQPHHKSRSPRHSHPRSNARHWPQHWQTKKKSIKKCPASKRQASAYP